MATKVQKVAEETAGAAKKVGGFLQGLFGGGKKSTKEAEEFLRSRGPEAVKRIPMGERPPRRGELPSGFGTPNVYGPSGAEEFAYARLLARPSGRRTLASMTGEFPELPAGTTPGFRDFRTQSLLARGKSLEPRTIGDIALGAKKFAADKPKTSFVLGGLGGLGALSIGAGMLRGLDGGDQLDQAQILDIISKSGVGQSTEDYLKSLAEQQISDLSEASSFSPEIQAQLDARQLQYEDALIDANSRYLEAIGGGASVPAASMGAYGQQAQAAQAAAEADTGTAVSGLTPVYGSLATDPDMLREEGARQQALQNIMANTAAGSDQRARDLAALGGAESVANFRSDYENLLLAQRIQSERDRQAAEQEINAGLFDALSRVGLERVQAGQGVGSAGYVDKINEYVVEYESLSDTQKAALAEVNGISNAADYATTRLRQDYGV